MCKDEVKCCRKRPSREESVADESVIQIAVNGSPTAAGKGSAPAGGLSILPLDAGDHLTGGTNVAVVCELQLPLHNPISSKSESAPAMTTIRGQQLGPLPSDHSASQISSNSSSHQINPDITSVSTGTVSVPTGNPFSSSAEQVRITISSGEENTRCHGDNQKGEAEDDDLPVWRLSPNALQKLRDSDKTLQLAIKRLSRDLEQIRGEEMNALLDGASSTQDN